jgi:hypothetical protein
MLFEFCNIFTYLPKTTISKQYFPFFPTVNNIIENLVRQNAKSAPGSVLTKGGSG